MSKLENLIKNLEKANKSLKEALEMEPTRINKDATIKRFEFTFELSWKTLQEYIREQGLDCNSPKSCIRESVRLELIDDVEKWFEFLDNRNLTTHCYNEDLADRVYTSSKSFSKEIDIVLEKVRN